MTLAPTLAIWVKLTLSVDRSIANPSSFVELSVHVRSISVGDTPVAASALGALDKPRTASASMSSNEKVTGRLVVALLTDPNRANGAATCKAAVESVTTMFHVDGSGVPSGHTFRRRVVGLAPCA